MGKTSIDFINKFPTINKSRKLARKRPQGLKVPRQIEDFNPLGETHTSETTSFLHTSFYIETSLVIVCTTLPVPPASDQICTLRNNLEMRCSSINVSNMSSCVLPDFSTECA